VAAEGLGRAGCDRLSIIRFDILYYIVWEQHHCLAVLETLEQRLHPFPSQNTDKAGEEAEGVGSVVAEHVSAYPQAAISVENIVNARGTPEP